MIVGIMYKKIVNHPYLIHWPLDYCGLPKIDNDLIRSSGKLLVLDAMLAKLKAQDHKVLLFSTMTMILDVIEDYLSLRDYNYVRLDGRIKIDERKTNIHNFNSDSEVFLFLLSTRAGGVGLNLTSADTVIIYDSDWVCFERVHNGVYTSRCSTLFFRRASHDGIRLVTESTSGHTSDGTMPQDRTDETCGHL